MEQRAPLIGVDDLEPPEWAVGIRALAQAGVVHVARAVPAAARALAGWAWDAAPRTTLLAGLLYVLDGVATALGVLATADVFTRLLAEGPTPARVVAALPALALVAAAAVAGGLLQAGVGAITASLAPRIEQVVQVELYRELIEVDLVAFDDADFTALVDRAEEAVPRIGRGAELVGDLVAGLVQVVAAVVAAGLVHPVLAPVALLAAAPQGWATLRRIQLDFASALAMISTRRRLHVTGNLVARRENAAEIRAVTAQDVLLAEHERIATTLGDEAVRVGRRQNTLTTVGRGLSGAGTVLGYVVLGLLLYAGGLPLPLAGTAVVALQRASSAVVSTVAQANFLFEAGLQIEFYTRCRTEARARRRPADDDGAVAGPAVVTLDGVTFSYPDQTDPAVAGVDLTLRRGEVVALVGENGSGKSTLAKLLVGLYLPDAGTVCWDGRPTGGLAPRDLQEHVALVAQEPVRWPVTAENNVRVGRLARPDPDDAAFTDAVDRAGARPVLDDLPDGRATVLSRAFQGGRDLSGGQWQRIAVARGLYRDASLVVADEPTAALDARAEHAVFGALRELSAGGDRMTVLVTHRLANVRSADRIVVLEHGRIVEEGTHDELMARAGLYHDLFTLQGAAYR